MPHVSPIKYDGTSSSSSFTLYIPSCWWKWLHAKNITNKCNFMLKINLLASSECNWMYHNFFASATCWIWWITHFSTHLMQYRTQKNITSDVFLSCPLQIIICNDQWSPTLNPPNVFFTTTPTQKCKVEQTIIYSVKNSHVLYLGNYS